MADTTIDVSGIHCDGCESRIRTVLGRIEGVRAVAADHRTQTVTIRFDPRRVDQRRLAGELTRIGFPVREPA